MAQGEEKLGVEPSENKSIEDHWYGWQIMIAGGVSLALPAISLIEGSAETVFLTFGLGGLGYCLGGPMIHWAHDATGNGFASLGINVVSPLLLGLVGLGLGYGDSESAQIGVGVGIYAGAVGAILIDSIWLAYEPVEPVTAPEGSSFNIGLSVGLNGLSIVGQF